MTSIPFRQICVIALANVFACLFFSGVLNAQGSRSDGLLFSCISWKQLTLKNLHYRDGKEYIPIKMNSARRSERYLIKESNNFELYVKDANATNGNGYTLVGSTPVSRDISEALFFVVELPSGTGMPLRIMTFDDSLLAFPEGAFRFINMSDKRLTVGFDDEVSPIAPRGVTVVETKTSSNGGFMPFIVADDMGNRLYETKLLGKNTGREMVFILPSLNRKNRVDLKFLSQTILR